ncbi:hypothetical protein [uncultured Nocardioides sp.]|uniref:hypothetical protein n=1 Tax=uncultured Nocardioides sp. TaxID=198441 RepID=UPI00260D816F|nr:hypothetical protein [uncultured Nocardioides sp.]
MQQGQVHDGAPQGHAGADDRTGHSQGDVDDLLRLVQDSALDRHSWRFRQACHPTSLLLRRRGRLTRSG